MFIKIIYKMLYYDRSDVSEGINVIKVNISKKCIICHYHNVQTIGENNLPFKQLPVTVFMMF